MIFAVLATMKDGVERTFAIVANAPHAAEIAAWELLGEGRTRSVVAQNLESVLRTTSTGSAELLLPSKESTEHDDPPSLPKGIWTARITTAERGAVWGLTEGTLVCIEPAGNAWNAVYDRQEELYLVRLPEEKTWRGHVYANALRDMSLPAPTITPIGGR